MNKGTISAKSSISFSLRDLYMCFPDCPGIYVGSKITAENLHLRLGISLSEAETVILHYVQKGFLQKQVKRKLFKTMTSYALMEEGLKSIIDEVFNKPSIQ